MVVRAKAESRWRPEGYGQATCKLRGGRSKTTGKQEPRCKDVQVGEWEGRAGLRCGEGRLPDAGGTG